MINPKNISILLIAAVLTCLIYSWISSLPRVSDISHHDIHITAETGEEIFWGKGRCHVCHRVGERGYGLRAPNLGEGKEGPIIAVRAQERAKQIGLGNGTEYLVQSLVEPGAFVVPKYQNEMPEVFNAPIALSPPEIKAVILYLQTLGGAANRDEVNLPPKLLAALKRPAKRSKLQIDGDIEAGRQLFFDLQGPAACAACHVGTNSRGQAEGSAIGPQLTEVASFRTAEHLFQKLVKPDSNIVSGYEEVLIRTKSALMITGLIKDEDPDVVVLVNKTGENLKIRKDEILSLTRQSVSMMPSNYQELLTRKQMENLLAYLLTLDGN